MTAITIIDDEKSLLRSLTFCLEAEGYNVEAFDCPIVALPRTVLQPPHLLILNGKMPAMHGIEFFLKYRADCTGPVMFLSASADDIELELEARGVAADAYVSKPFSQRYLIRMAQKLTSGRLRDESSKNQPGGWRIAAGNIARG